MSKFKVGDRVKIMTEEEVKGIGSLKDKVFEVGGITSDGVLLLKGHSLNNLCFLPDWCELVETSEGFREDISKETAIGMIDATSGREQMNVPEIVIPEIPIESSGELLPTPKMRIYIAGKTGGLDMEKVRLNFESAAAHLRKWGFEPISPLAYCEDGLPWVDCILTLLPVLKTCQGIYLLDNWEDSDSAKVEKLFAEKDGMFVIKEII